MKDPRVNLFNTDLECEYNNFKTYLITTIDRISLYFKTQQIYELNYSNFFNIDAQINFIFE